MDTPPAEVAIDAELVARLVAVQHPELAGPVSWLSSGWDNELFRLGSDLVVRMPRRAVAVPLLEHELAWLPALQPLVAVPIPVPVAAGEPSAEYPWPWSIARWMAGRPSPGCRWPIATASCTRSRSSSWTSTCPPPRARP